MNFVISCARAATVRAFAAIMAMVGLSLPAQVAAAAGTIEVLHSFEGGRAGANPVGNLVQLPDGRFIGTTSGGFKQSSLSFGDACLSGQAPLGCGTLFSFLVGQSSPTTLHAFTGGADGGYPTKLLLNSAGDVLGLTYSGGSYQSSTSTPLGTVYKLTGGGAFQSLHSFDGINGANPRQLVEGYAGVLFGITAGGGPSFASCPLGSSCAVGVAGVAYSMNPGNGATVSLAAAASSDVYYSGPVQAGDTSLYATNSKGVFRLTTAGALTQITNDGAAGCQDNLVLGADGSLYASSRLYFRSPNRICRITTSGAVSTLATLNINFEILSLMQANDSQLYGTYWDHATNIKGIFQLDPATGVLNVLFSSSANTFGPQKGATLTAGSDGFLYGTTAFDGLGYGTIYRLTTVCSVPTGEVTMPEPKLANTGGWGSGDFATTVAWRVILQPSTTSFAGRRVTEVFDLDAGQDACWVPGSPYPSLRNHSSSTWTVDSDNALNVSGFGDIVGWLAQQVSFYRSQNRAPCTAYLKQKMYISCPDGSNRLYITNILEYGMTATTVTSGRAGARKTRRW